MSPGGSSTRGRDDRAGAAAAATPFIGRRLEFDWLDHRLGEALDGHPQVVFIVGEAGIGKTRLVTELCARAAGADADVSRGRCYEDLTLPYLPFLDGLLAYLIHVPADSTDTLASDVALIRRLLHHDATDQAAAASTPPIPSSSGHLQLFLSVSRATIARAQRRPIVVVVEDLHWADRASMELFTHLAFAVADASAQEPVPLLLVATHRPLEPQSHVAHALDRMRRERICRTLEPQGLSESEVGELIESLDAARPSPQLIATVREATQGNPLFVTEVVHHLMHQGVLRDPAAPLVGSLAPTALRFPDPLTGLIAARLQGLSAACRSMLTVAACLGDRFSLPALRAAMDATAAALDEWLDEAARQRLVLRETPTMQFAHPLIRHVIYTEADAVQRQQTHHQIARALERLYPDDLDAHWLEIAHHYISAGSGADADTVVRYARRAGDQAFAVCAWGEAAAYYESALSARVAADDFPSAQRADLHFKAAAAHYRNLDAGPCIAHYERAVTAARQVGDLRHLAEALLGQTRAHLTLAADAYGTRIDTRALEDVLAQLGEEAPALRGRIWSILAEVACYGRQPDHAESLAQRALQVGEQIGDQALCAHACTTLGWAHMDRMRVRDSLQSCERSLAHARASKDLWVLGWPLGRQPMLLMWLGRLDDAAVAAHEALAVTRQTLDWAEHSLALSVLGSVAVARGAFDTAESHTQTTLLLAQRSHYPWGAAVALAGLACARTQRGRLRAATDALAPLAQPGGIFAQLGTPSQILAWVYGQLLQAHAGRLDEVRAQCAALPPVGDEDRTDIKALPGFCALVEIADLTALPGLAAAPYEVLALAAERGVQFTTGWVFLMERVLGVAAALQRSWEAAEAHFERALGTAAAAGAQPELGRTCLDYTRMLVARGARGAERDRAIALLERAMPILSALQMEPFLNRAGQLADSLGVPLATAAPVETDLRPQEVEILARLARGHSDDHIATELLLSPATVAEDVRRICAKVGVEGRAAATAYALKKGLASSPRWRPVARPAPSVVAEGPAEHPYRALPAGQPLVILFTDLEGSTPLIERLGDARAQALLRTHNGIIRACLERHGGTEVKHTGDGIMASFVSAAGAIDCAVAMQKAFAADNQQHPDTPLRVRIGLNAGDPVKEEGQLFGAAVNAAARICNHAEAGQILVSDVVRRLSAYGEAMFADRGPVPLKGFSHPFRLHAVQWEDDRTTGLVPDGRSR
jgi:class 3 adenylate cyclase/DNA-binding CsgD family transcriptional regulator